MPSHSATGPGLTTRRLILRPVHRQDAEALHQLWTSPGVRRFLWDDDIIPMARTHEVIERSDELFGARRGGLWVASTSGDSTALAGFGGLWPFRDPPEMELLYGVAEPLWGRGYATEIACAVTSYCFEWLALPAMRASTDAANLASIRVLEKCGFRFMRRDNLGGLDTVFYDLPRHLRRLV